ncbi:microcephalin [Leptinotarsa decemlineata]|uniref:microcephalin n=1 Tax=Leptinotarsa decemlineata TaxID=7539 RepID=UPI003D304ADC
MSETNDALFEKFMSCPLKRKLIMTLIESEKDKIDEYRKKIVNQKTLEKTGNPASSPLRKAQKKYQFESPTALLRRRALEQNKNSGEIHQTLSKESSASSESSESSEPPDFDKILTGVVAFIDIKSKEGDRSSGVKAILRSMGATIAEHFNREVTHVIFKDGSFSTYQKANLLNIHLVSVLWIEACRNSRMKVAEKKFPALGTDVYDHNISAVCSQIQKDYEEIVREEYCRSLSTGTPLPSTKALIDKRRTIMTPNFSNNSLMERFHSQEIVTSPVRNIMSKPGRKTINIVTPVKSSSKSSSVITQGDSDLEAFIGGKAIQKTVVGIFDPQNRIIMEAGNDVGFDSNVSVDQCVPKEKINDTHNDNNNTQISSKENSPPDTPHDFYTKKTPKKRQSRINRNIFSNTSSENSINGDDSLCKRRTRSLRRTTDIIHNQLPRTSNDTKKKKSPQASSDASNLDPTSSIKMNENIGMPARSKKHLIKEIVDKTGSTSMSTLQLSNNPLVNSCTTNMSSLQISSDTDKNIPDFNSNNNSFSPIQSNVMNSLLELLDNSLQSSDNITRRKKSGSEKFVSAVQERHSSFTEKGEMNYESNNSRTIKISSRNRSKRSLNFSRISKENSSFDVKSKTPQLENSISIDREKHGKSKENNTESNIEKNHSETPGGSETTQNKYNEGILDSGENENIKICTREPMRVSEIHENSNSLSSKSDKESYSGKRKNSASRIGRKLYDPNSLSQKKCFRNDLDSQDIKLNAENSCTSKPEVTLSVRAKNFVDKHNINVDKILDQHCEKFDNDPKPPKKRKENEPVEKYISGNGQEQNELRNSKNVAEKCDDKNLTNIPNKSLIEITDATKEAVDAKKGDYNKNEVKIVKSKKPRAVEKPVNRRCSLRLTQRFRKTDITPSAEKKVERDMLKESRRSTREFDDKVDTKKKKIKDDKLQQPSIVCTKMHKDEIGVFSQIVKKLGGFIIEDEVTKKTTHLVAGEAKRTINMLRAITTGCWIVNQKWLFQSLEAGKWLPEEDFELNDFSPAVQQCRLQRQAFGPSYSMDIFQDCGNIFIARESIPRCSDLRELVTLCKGKFTANARKAKIIVGESLRYEGVICVKENWILDSITFNKKMSFKKYIIS